MTTTAQLSTQLNTARITQQSCYELLDQLPEQDDPDSPEHKNYSRIKEASKLIADVVNDLSAAHEDALHS